MRSRGQVGRKISERNPNPDERDRERPAWSKRNQIREMGIFNGEIINVIHTRRGR